MDIGYFDSNYHLVPPLRSLRDRDALRRGVEDGTIDAICSDHTPVDDDAKQLPFGESEAGATGLELLLALTLKWSEESRIALPKAIAKVTSEPARILGIGAVAITAGANADLCIFDPHLRWKVDPASLKSQGKNTPFAGYEVNGRVRYTLVGGHIVYEG
jgi:dihydroorotase